MTPFLHKYHKHLIITLLVIIAIGVWFSAAINYHIDKALGTVLWDITTPIVEATR